jgi:hypothetical protein
MLRAAPVHGIREVREVWSVEEEEEEEERLQRNCTVAAHLYCSSACWKTGAWNQVVAARTVAMANPT